MQKKEELNRLKDQMANMQERCEELEKQIADDDRASFREKHCVLVVCGECEGKGRLPGDDIESPIDTECYKCRGKGAVWALDYKKGGGVVGGLYQKAVELGAIRD